MRTLKDNQRKKMILAAVVILIIGSIIVGICTNNATNADTTETCEHEYVTKYDEINHWQECSKCGFVKADSIVEHSYNEKGKCECGATKSTCEHEYVTKHNKTNHWEECSKCGAIKEDSVKEHTYDKNGKCECGETKSTEETCEHEYVTKYDKTNHWQECSKCGFIKADSIVEHAYDENGKCECGATKKTEETCEHEYVTKYDETDHWQECSKCGFIKANSIVEHAYDENGKCECGATKKTEETCEHEYVTKYDKTNHWEACSKCGEVKANSTEKHTFDESGKCKCGATKQTEETCKHEYVTKYDKTNHWEECSKCGEIKANSTEKHTYDENGKCKCGATKSAEENNNGGETKGDENKNNTGKDNTSTDKDIPYTGAKNVGIIAIVALAIIVTVSAVKMRKYKGI